MAAPQHRHGNYRVIFGYRGKQRSFTLGDVSSEDGETKTVQVDYLLMRLKQRLATVPPGIGIAEYVQFDGKVPPPEIPLLPAKLTLAQLRDRYVHRNNPQAPPLSYSVSVLASRVLRGYSVAIVEALVLL